MKWHFTATQILRGKSRYSLGNFFNDLKKDIYREREISHAEKEQLFFLLYHIFYLTAIEKDTRDIVHFLDMDENRETLEVIKLIQTHYQKDITMLRATVQKKLFILLEQYGENEEISLTMLNTYLNNFHETSLGIPSCENDLS